MAHEEKRPLKVFLCHASGDKPPVRDLYKHLTAEGVDAWLDQEKLLPGQDWRLEIPKAVQEADVVVVCLSRKSITKEGYVQKEIKFALDSAEEKPEGTIFLIPARLEDCSVPERLSRWHWVDLYEENGYIKLLRSLKLRADVVGATIEPTSYEDSDKEHERRIKQLYTEGLAAFYTEDWDRACHRFQSILSEQPKHKSAAEKLTEAEQQRSLARLYALSTEALQSENWQVAIQTLEGLSQKAPDYKDAAQLLRNARKQKQLKELYAEAKTLHEAQKWEAVVKVFGQISAIDPTYPDPDGLLPSAQKEVTELKRLANLDELYSNAVNEMDAGNWYEARRLLESVHKSQTGFLETERLLRKVEDEISREEEQRKQNDQINTLYEQAHGLLRSKKWRNALDKLEQIRKLDEHFPDTDGIAEKVQKELACEEQEAERQNKLAALYAEAVRLLKEDKYQEALDKWQEVKAVDPKYPDRQWVQRTARKRLVETAKPVQIKPRFVMSKPLRLGIVGLLVIGVVVTGVLLAGRGSQTILPPSTSAPIQTAILIPTRTITPGKTNTPRPATPVPTTSGYSDPTMYDDFDNQNFENTYNTQLWNLNAFDFEKNTWVVNISNGLGYGYMINQSNGQLMIGVNNGKGLFSLDTNELKITRPMFSEARLYLDPATTKAGTDLAFKVWSGPGETVCDIRSVSVNPNKQGIYCYSNYFNKSLDLNVGKASIEPGWHTFRFEVYPEPFEIASFVDGLMVGKFSPLVSMPENYNEIKSSTFLSTIQFSNDGSAKTPAGYFDYVRMGAIEDDPNILFYEDFNNSTYDGSYDKSKWNACGVDSGSAIVQNNGILSMSHTSTSSSGYQGTSFCPNEYMNASISVPTYFEARLMIPSDHLGQIGFAVENNPTWQNLHTSCQIEHVIQSSKNYPTLVKCRYISNNSKDVWNSHSTDIKPNVWHTIRIEIRPANHTFTYYLDGQQYDSSQPDVDFNPIKWLFSLYVTSFQSTETIGYFDDVRVGRLEK